MKIRKHLKKLSILALLVFLNQIFFPTYVLALSGGPTQPEVHGFEPVGTNQMVDVFSGDFTYNIPLFDIGGYPMNIAYHSGVGMEQEASWVGLGWSLTPGAINRNLKGLPDDFKADEVKFMRKMKANHTIGLDLKLDPEAFGFELGDKAKQIFGDEQKLSLGVGVTYNNYTGVDINKSVSVTFSNGMINPSVGYSDNGGLSVSAKPSLAAVAKARKNNSESGTNFLGKLASFVALDGEISWSSTSGLGLSANRDFNLGKLNKYIRSSSVGANIQLNDKVYSPGSDISMWNYGFRANVALGTEIFGGDAQGQVDFFYNAQRLGPFGNNRDGSGDVVEWYLKAYGVEYGHEATGGYKNDLLDFNREHEYPLRDESPLLPISQLTYDVFSISAQGAGGSFRSFRNDYPIVGKNRTADVPNTQVNIGLDISSVNLVKIGGNASLMFANSSNGYWNSGAAANIGFTDRDETKLLYEPKYFKKGGEFGVFDESYLDEIGGEEAARFRLSNQSAVSNTLEYEDGTAVSHGTQSALFNSDVQKNARAPRASAILALTKDEAHNYGFPFSKDRKTGVTKIKSYSGSNDDTEIKDGPGYAQSTDLDRLEDMPGGEHHYGEFQITQDNGYTYVYGLPVYNNQTVEASFAINKPLSNPNTSTDQGYVEYQSSDPTEDNSKGRDNFVSRKEIPEYAHSFLITQILSPDYVDVLGDGITDDDIGEAVIFNYEKVHDDYGWRNPMHDQANMGRYMEGLQTLNYDDKASYVYGTKEIWVLHSIESRNMVAQFFTSDREDSYGVEDESGTLDMSKSQRRLDRIELYNKIDRARASSASGYKATPVKVVHFTYDYSLCDGVPNNGNDEGKLTLKKLAFSYGNSGTGLLNPYEFTYGGLNPDYNPLATDRWGNYMDFDNTLPNNQFPYVDQDAVNTDQYAAAWLLDKIELPSGGEINVEYESDDYAYVMEKNALSMVPIVGVGRTEDFTAGNKLYETYGVESNYLYFELPSSGTYSNNDDVRADFEPEGALYFKALFHVKDKVLPTSNDKEYVSGYVKISDVGLCPWTSGQKYGYVQIEEKRDRNTRYQAMSHAAWKFMLGSLSERINGLQEPSGDLLKDGKDYILSNLSKITQLLKGQMGKMKAEQYGQYIDLSKSIMRLKEPTGFKLGGGSRVKQISMSDGWDQMTGSAEGSNDYGSVYSYTIDDEDGNPLMSSGVASYEPMMGNEENPYKQPIYYRYKPKSIMGLVKVGNEIEEYMVGPYGEMFFPGAGVGYSRIKVKSLATARIDAAEITGMATGYTVNEFYTAKDFPIIQDKTVPDGEATKFGNALSKKFTGNDKSELAMTQGYSFILNNMHGKPKGNISYGQNTKMPVSSTSYVYRTDDTDSRRLDNRVDVLTKSGLVENDKLIGVEVDFVADAHQSLNSSYQTRAQPGADGFSLGIPPFIAIPNLWFELSSSSNNLRYISNTKVIYKYGILDEVVQTDETSEVHTKNLLWDAESGQVLLTSVKNEYESPLENFNMPAHFAYSGMEGAYKNLDVRISDQTVDQGVLTVDFGEASDYFEPGDEVILGDKDAYNRLTYKKAWVLDIVNNTSPTNDEVFLIDREGKSITGNSILQFDEMRIIRSGKRNQTGATILAVTSNQDILDQLSVQNEITNPLQLSSAEFSNEWNTYCDRLIEQDCATTDDLRLVLNCLWSKGSSIGDDGQYDEDIGINLDTECPIDLQTNLREQAKDMSDITVNVKTSTSKTYYTYTININISNPDMLSVEADLWEEGIDFSSDLTYGDVLNPGLVTSAEINIGSFTDFGSGSPSWLETMLDQHIGSGNYTISVVQTYPFVDKQQVVVEQHKAPWFKFLAQQASNEILIGVGGVDVWDDVNYAWDRDGSVPGDVACTLKLQAQPYPGTSVSYSDIESFGSMSYDPITEKYTLTADLVEGGTMDFVLINDCLDLMWCEFDYACGPLESGKVVNPFIIGVRGNWRPKNNYFYHTSRSTTLTPGALTNASHTDIRTDGVMENFSLDVFAGGAPFVISGDRWISPSTITEYTPSGNEIENMDALGRYSSEVFGYDRRVVVASANNAPHHNIAFDGFEEYTYPYHGNCRKEMHWAMSQYVGLQVCSVDPLPLSSLYSQVDPTQCGSQNAEISTDQAHTGKYSLKIEQDMSTVTFFTEDIVKATCTPAAQSALSPFILDDCNCIGTFEPDAAEKYYFSAWVKEEQLSQPESYHNTKINLKVYDDQSNLIYTKVLVPSGPITEGWQRISGDFEIPSGSGLTLRTEVEVGTTTSINAAYIDDIRIQPFNSQMKTYVYKHNDLKLSAELDANNYATFYEYDVEGRLLRIKKETEKGIMTIQESRYGISQ